MKGELSIRDKYSPAYTFSYTCTISKGYGNLTSRLVTNSTRATARRWSKDIAI